MKKELLFIPVFILVISSTLALEINLQEEYQPGSTFMATLEGNILEQIDETQISFYRKHIQMPFLYDIAKINNVYHIYAILPDKEENYSIKIKDVDYKDSQGTHREDLTAKFKVQGNKSDFSINPGFIITDKNFFINVQNNLDTAIIVESVFKNTSILTEISAADSEKLEFEIDEEDAGIESLLLQSGNTIYEIPIYIFGETSENPDIPPVIERKLIFTPDEAINTLDVLDEFIFPIELFNPGQENIENLVFQYPESFEASISIVPEEIEIIEAGKSEQITFTFLFEEEGEFGGEVIVLSEEEELGRLNLIFLVEKNATINTTLPNTTIIKDKDLCANLGGIVCELNQECEGDLIEKSIEEDCCSGTCKKKEIKNDNKGDYKWLTVTIIIIAIAVVLYFIYVQVKKKKLGEDILSKKTDRFEKRFKPDIKDKEIKGRLES